MGNTIGGFPGTLTNLGICSKTKIVHILTQKKCKFIFFFFLRRKNSNFPYTAVPYILLPQTDRVNYYNISLDKTQYLYFLTRAHFSLLPSDRLTITITVCYKRKRNDKNLLARRRRSFQLKSIVRYYFKFLTYTFSPSDIYIRMVKI